jgi:hypothetical protein
VVSEEQWINFSEKHPDATGNSKMIRQLIWYYTVSSPLSSPESMKIPNSSFDFHRIFLISTEDSIASSGIKFKGGFTFRTLLRTA